MIFKKNTIKEEKSKPNLMVIDYKKGDSLILKMPGVNNKAIDNLGKQLNTLKSQIDGDGAILLINYDIDVIHIKRCEVRNDSENNNELVGKKHR